MPLACLRLPFFLALVLSTLALGGAFYLEAAFGLEPCPLCQSQRVVLGGFAIVCLVALLHGAGRVAARVYSLLSLLFALGGAALASRQVWLQSQSAAPVGECSHPLSYLFEHITLRELFDTLLVSSRECVALTWSFLDLSLPEWSLLAFLLLAVLCLPPLKRAWRLKKP